MGDIIPTVTLEALNGLEIALLLLAALLHDAGMVVSDREKAEALVSESFRRFREESHADRSKAIEDAKGRGDFSRAAIIEDALLAEYYRRLHSGRSRDFLMRHFANKLRYREIDFSDYLGLLCESHVWGVEESNDPRKPKKAVIHLADNARIYGVQVNLQYLACCLRLADIMDFDRSRTPLAVFRQIDFTELKSWEEWNKHLQVHGWEINPTTVSYDIPCTHPAFYVAVQEFLGWVDEELRLCRHLIDSRSQSVAGRYKLLLPLITDRRRVRMLDPSYVAGAFRFELEYDNIINLLMDRSLYPDSSLYLRELLQNALDACRRREAALKELGLGSIYQPKIVVRDYGNDFQNPRVEFEDNGVGMSLRIVEQYFLRVGRSFYRSSEFDLERARLRELGVELDSCSQFGIGILSCFMVGDRFEIVTFQEGSDPLHISVEGPSKYFTIRRLPRPAESAPYRVPRKGEADGPPHYPGTKVTVYLRQAVKTDSSQVLDTFGANLDYPVSVLRGSAEDGEVLIPPRRFETRQLKFSKSFSESLTTALDDILMPSFASLETDATAARIGGRAWLWLLRDHRGMPSVSSGFLSIENDLRITGVPSVLEHIESQIPESVAAATNRREIFNRARDLSIRSGFGLRRHQWEALSYEEKLAAEECFSKRHGKVDGAARPWFLNPDAAKSLAEGTYDWAEMNVRLMNFSTASRPIQEIALNGILIPSGIVRWSPFTGNSARVELLAGFAGMQIDVRGGGAPAPAAHRLFFLASETEALAGDVARSIVNHAIDLLQGHVECRFWRAWLGVILRIYRFRLGVEQPMDMTSLDRCRLAVVKEGKLVYLTHLQVLELFDELAPTTNSLNEPGVATWDEINKAFIGEQAGLPSSFLDVTKLPFRRIRQGTQ